MANPKPLPPEVAAALQKGNVVEAIKLLRKTFDLSLKDAKAAIDERSHVAQEKLPAGAPPPRPKGMPMGSPPNPAPQQLQLPLEAVQALRRGNEIEAIRIVREKARIGLKEAKDTVDAYRRGNPDVRSGLSPGEVPAGRNEYWAIAVIAIVLFGLWLFLA